MVRIGNKYVYAGTVGAMEFVLLRVESFKVYGKKTMTQTLQFRPAVPPGAPRSLVHRRDLIYVYMVQCADQSIARSAAIGLSKHA